MSELESLAKRFQGVDVQYRRDGWDSRCPTPPTPRWRARMLTSKNERSEYRLMAYGDSPDHVVAMLALKVRAIDEAK